MQGGQSSPAGHMEEEDIMPVSAVQLNTDPSEHRCSSSNRLLPQDHSVEDAVAGPHPWQTSRKLFKCGVNDSTNANSVRRVIVSRSTHYCLADQSCFDELKTLVDTREIRLGTSSSLQARGYVRHSDCPPGGPARRDKAQELFACSRNEHKTLVSESIDN